VRGSVGRYALEAGAAAEEGCTHGALTGRVGVAGRWTW
jgi:hypothetical protein